MDNPIREYIDENDMKVEEFAEKAGVSRATVYNYINGTTELSLEKAKQVAEALELSTVEFWKKWERWKHEKRGDEIERDS